MAYRSEKTDTGTDIVIDGWEKGIAASPHKGLANIQNGNISTEMGEVSVPYYRVQQTIQSSATGTGTLSYLSTDHVTLDISGSNDYFKGQWITVTNSNHTGEVPNGTYYVPPTTGTGFKLANYYAVSATTTQSVNYLVVAGGGAGGHAANSAGGAGGGGAGDMKTGTLSLASGYYAVTIGAAGAHSGGIGGNGGDSVFSSITSKGGGGGGIATGGNGANGGSGGGGGGSGGLKGTATGTGHNGGDGGTAGRFGGGGGGGATSAGTAGLDDGGAGGAGTASSISGGSVTYAGGGGGGSSLGTKGSGGAGGGGAGGQGDQAGASATVANSGSGGGGGSSNGGGAFNGGDGAAGTVVISATIGVVSNPTTCGGTHTTSGGNDIWTYTASGAFTPVMAATATPTATLSGFTAGLTATITLTTTMAKPLAKATENYQRSGVTYYRFYVLDDNNIVWVYDTYNEVLYSASDNVNWFIPDYSTSWCTNATGIAVLDGFLIGTADSGTYAKPVCQLGGVNTQTTTWAALTGDVPWNGNPTSTHFCYVGHQGYCYITDRNYIRSIFPDSTLQQAVTETGGTVTDITTTTDNVQSLGGYTLDTVDATGGYFNAIPSPISGPEPFPATTGEFVPAVLFTDGTLPLSITAGKVYYLLRNGSDFRVYSDPGMTSFSAPALTGAASAGDTSGTLTAAWPWPTGYYYTDFPYVGGEEYHMTLFTNNNTAVTWIGPLAHNGSSATITPSGKLDLSVGSAGNQYYATFHPTASGVDPAGSTPLYVISTQRLSLPNFETAQCMTEIGNNVLIGCAGNVIYPWDQVSNLPGGLISLPESNVQSLLTVNQIAYAFAGNQGNIYVTDTSQASLVLNLPDYLAGVPGSPGTYIESTYTWLDSMYLRGRVYFSVLDQSTTKAGNTGGIWSFYPTQNLYTGQDTGLALRLEQQNSYNSYNGGALLLINRGMQTARQPLYWSAWESSVTSPTYGVDYSTGGSNASFVTVVETDFIPVGTMLNQKTFKQLEYKLGSPLDAGATVTAKYRVTPTDTWTACGTFITESSALSGYTAVNFQKNQWLQFQFTLTPITSSADSNSFVRLKEVRLR